MKTWTILIFTLLNLIGCSSVPTSFSPQRPLSPSTFTHADFHRVLAKHVTDGVVDYPALVADQSFAAYLTNLQHLAPQQLPTPNHRLAFWINAYNAFAIQGILNGFSPSTFSGRYTYFIGQDYLVGDQPINLYDLERHILIPGFREPRIHFAIVCASQSCPKLQSWAYTPDQIDQQLTLSAKQFINDPSRNRFDPQQKIAYLSQIFDWFQEDFENHSGSLLTYIAQFVTDQALAEDLRRTPYRIEFLDYDWTLNGLPPNLPSSLSNISVPLSVRHSTYPSPLLPNPSFGDVTPRPDRRLNHIIGNLQNQKFHYS